MSSGRYNLGHGGAVIGPLDQVTFPVSRDLPFFDLGWSVMDADHL